MKKLIFILMSLCLIGTSQSRSAASKSTAPKTSTINSITRPHRHAIQHFHKRPHHCAVIHFRHVPYYYATGIYYRKINKLYQVVRPEIGMTVAELPASGVKTIETPDGTRFVYDGVIYKQVLTKKKIKYEVVGFIK